MFNNLTGKDRRKFKQQLTAIIFDVIQDFATKAGGVTVMEAKLQTNACCVELRVNTPAGPEYFEIQVSGRI